MTGPSYQTQQRSPWRITIWIIAAAVLAVGGIVAVSVLLTDSDATQAAAKPPAQRSELAELEAATSPEEDFLFDLQFVDGLDYTMVAKGSPEDGARVIAEGRRVCRQLAQGEPADFVAAVVAARQERPREEAERYVETAAEHLCPQQSVSFPG